MSTMPNGKETSSARPAGSPTAPARAPARDHRHLRRRGTIVAVGLGVAFVGVLGWYALRGGRTAGQEPVDAERPRPRSRGGAGGMQGELELVEGQRIEIPVMDKKDLRRQIG